MINNIPDILVPEISDLQRNIAEWSDKQFGYNRKPECVIAHLKKEVKELYKDSSNLEEYADCLMLLLDAARMANINSNLLLYATKAKLEENKKRKWGNPDKDGVIEHIHQ